MGNPNTLSNFTTSWQRATRFLEPIFQPEESASSTRENTGINAGEQCATDDEESLLISQLGDTSGFTNYGAIDDGAQIFDHRRYSLDSDQDAAGYAHLIEENISSHRGEKTSTSPLGKSTVPMTIFNCTNILVGVGILALPLGLQQCGWVVGLVFLTLPAVVTAYTAKLLVRCQETDPNAATYGDIADLAFGSTGRHLVEVLFVFELITANVALIILFADSVSPLAPMLSVSAWKVVIAVSLIPLNFVPLRFLSVSSAIGIFCIAGILVLLVATGLTKPDTPGSLWQFAPTRAFPTDWQCLPATLGLFMAPWGGHSVIPSVVKDMRHPQKYTSALAYTYGITYSLALSIAALGYLMFGDSVLAEVTSNILSISTYPHAVSVVTLVLVAVVPLTKIALVNRPLMDTINQKLGTGIRRTAEAGTQVDDEGRSKGRTRTARVDIGIGALCNLLQLGLAIAIPNFDDVVALMGSALCITICIVLPACFYLKICRVEHNKMSRGLLEEAACWLLVVVGTVCAIGGTLFAVIDGTSMSR